MESINSTFAAITPDNWDLGDYAMRVLFAVVIFFVGKWLSGIGRSIFRKILEARKVDPVLISFSSNIVYALLIVMVVIAALEALGVDTTSAVAIVGASTLAVGLALQGSLSNLAAGVMIIIFRPFRIDDFIDAGGVTGIVTDLNIFETHLRTPDNKKVILPNGQITGGAITNFSANDTRRMDLVVGVSYDDDIRKVKKVLCEILENDEGVLKDPAYSVGLLEMADSSVNFAVRPWVKTPEYWDVFFRLQEAIKLRMDEEGITIPFPQQDVYMHQMDAKEGSA
ncbi:mechanosensitive ion channel family protein [Rubellicoccus peritrichatus]|uniref:Mechanosensitive ion channel n=1 Tax=Rubellicoccus peritrichatus TaxID=3080537 RepID=A0AAQ3QTY1_9BACT|nr:mechanosensitive ion channel domain-containing protein [Puniceicoccus sp. CR14]WOO39888.1 mechanosensitive ion channel [Puniceicoccus sp. CR14]